MLNSTYWDSTRTPTSGCRARISRAARIPSSVCVGGIRMSTMATSGGAPSTASISSAAVPHWAATVKPASVSRRATPSRKSRLSSASATCTAAPFPGPSGDPTPAGPTMPLSVQRPAVDAQADVDVASGRVRVRAHLVGATDDLLGQLVVADLRQRDVELHAEPQRALLGWRHRDAAVDRHVADLGALAAAHHADRALEAGREADREQLLGVGAAALAAQLRGRAQLDVELSVVGAPVAGGAPAGDRRLCRVEDLRHACNVPGLRCLPALALGDWRVWRSGTPSSGRERPSRRCWR